VDLATLIWTILSGFAWLAALRSPDDDAAGGTSLDDQDEEERRLWYGADLRNQIDRNG
jgi:hypothetical protein